MRRPSLSVQLYRRVLLLLALTGLAIGSVLYMVALREIGRASDAQLVNAARLLYMMTQDDVATGVLVRHDSVVAADGDPLLSTQETQAFQASYDSCMFAVFWQGRLIARSGWGAPVDRVPRRPGLHDFTAMGEQWRSYGMRGHDTRLLIVVAESGAMLEFSIGRLLGELALPLLALLAAAMVVLWWTLRKSLSQVERLASTLGARSLSDLEPLLPEEWPRDLEPLIVALNKLFARLEGAYELEQAFTDDVAHELRTPLAAIRAQAQVLRRLAPQGLGEDADRLVAMVDRANALIDGMLTLARLNATAVTARSVDVHALAAEVLAEAFVDLPEDAMGLSVIPDHIVRWRCDPSLLQIALSAVIGNALRHARAGGRLDVAIMRASDRLVVTIGDRGSGVPAAERERLLRRFEHGASASSGSGLGLSIASKAMSLLAGSIRLEDRTDGPGLLVILTLPSPTD
ncbi:HAMP domain-containing sensor histidine kinase [Novosphingobium resinovorum]|uniref:sensor histidine kinase n=1 Tax=Novosphingobium resinovorum TaxID=158500 RepID=UPI002ED58539|nr:HAMP domain-containing sensor histidine kinase [Novosphingobium resinovorum]